ncbi:hypothetical protein [Reyranella sp.]|uniref:hypothetical protein n=1 Tax=Reyranella sp. TaxID=1929291 RepID=UPI003D125BE1
MSRLTDAQQDAVTAQINGAIEGRKPNTDPQTWYAIHQGLTAADATERQRWASTNLVPFMGRLSAEDFAALEKLQASVRSNDGDAEQSRLQIITRMANDALRAAGIDPTPRPDTDAGSDVVQAARFHRALRDDLLAFESRGRMPTEAEAYTIVNGLRDTAIKSGWLRVSDRSASRTVMPMEQSDKFKESPIQEHLDTQVQSKVDQPDVHTAQSGVPFLAKPPNYPVPPRPIFRYKEPIPGLSGKEKAKDIPRDFRGMRPLVGESGRQAAERAFNERYGEGNWNLRDSRSRREFGKLQKYFDRGFRDPQSLPGPFHHIPGDDFGV